MRYIVKCMPDGSSSTIQVVASDVPHVVEAARIMKDQGLVNIVIQDIAAGREAEMADFLIAHGISATDCDEHA